MTKQYNDFADYVWTRAKERNIEKPADLAEASGLNRNALVRLLARQTTSPHLSSFAALARAIGDDPETLRARYFGWEHLTPYEREALDLVRGLADELRSRASGDHGDEGHR